MAQGSKNRLDYQAKLQRHPHDVSAGYSGSIAPGVILPQYFDIAQPGDAFYFNTRMFCRLQDTVTAFLGEIDVHVDYFFVPLQMIYTPFGQIFAQTDDVLTSLYKDLSARDRFPVCEVYKSLASGGDTYQPAGYRTDNLEAQGKGHFRLLDALNLNPLVVTGKPGVATSSNALAPFRAQPNISPWIPAAYQAIYQKFFRNDEFEKFCVEDYNIDQYYANDTFWSERLFRPRLAQRPADYFTTARVSPITSAVNSLGAVQSAQAGQYQQGTLSELFGKVNTWLSPGNSDGNTDFAIGYDGNSVDPGLDSFTSFNHPIPFELSSSYLGSTDIAYASAAGIRTLFALDKYLRIYGRAGKTYDDQILAHFGVKVPHDVKHDISHLKHYHFVMMSDPIYGTANIQNNDASNELVSSLGQVGGQTSGCLDTLDAEPEKFVAPVHGVFMAVAYVLTKPRYFGTYSKLHELDQRIKFPIPEFDKLGAQPLFAHECNPYFLATEDDVEDSDFLPTRIAWQNRYQEFKQKFNRSSYLYADLNKWFTRDASSPYPSQDPAIGENIYAPWMVARTPFVMYNFGAQSQPLPGYQFFERQDALDNVMVNSFQFSWISTWATQPHLILQSDPILTEFFAKVKKVSWMSPTGDPDL